MFSNFRGSKFVMDKRFRLKNFFEAVQKYKVGLHSSVLYFFSLATVILFTVLNAQAPG